jgi:hypothetical protein
MASFAPFEYTKNGMTLAAKKGRLAAAAAEGVVVYGLHRQRAALMTCLTPSVYRSDHIHFLDGAAGGYSAAATAMKGKRG